MQNLLEYLTKHKKELNLAEISRRAGYDSSYLKKAVDRQNTMSSQGKQRVLQVLSELVTGFDSSEVGE